jgi:undecaprenyl-diphosphatase
VNLLDLLQHCDAVLFQFLNHLIANPIWDAVMVAVTTQKYWAAPLLLVCILLVGKGGRRGRIALVLALLAVGASDWISARVIKPGVGRLRPCYTLENVRLLIPCGGKHSFPSSHAANSMAVAITLAYFFRRYSAWLFAVAFLVGYSRIVVGVHYPGDMLGGFVCGGLCAAVVLALYKKQNWQKA